MSRYKATIILAVVVLPLSLAWSRWLATVGEPQSVWMWCKILKACSE